MPDYSELLTIIKQASLEANEAAKPVNVCYGKVTNASPLKILVDQKLELGEAQLVLTRNVTDFTTSITIDWETESALTTHKHTINGSTDTDGEPAHSHSVDMDTGATSLKHIHEVSGTKMVTMHNALGKGEDVLLLRQQEGQKYIVLDRVVTI